MSQKPAAEPLVAVDIGSFSLKFVVFTGEAGDGSRRLKAINHLVIPPFQHQITPEEREKLDREGFEKECISRLQKWLTKHLTELLYDNQVQSKKAVSLASGRAVTIRYIELEPPAEAEQLPIAIQGEATKQMPFSMENAVFGHTVLGNTTREDKKLVQVMVAALQKDVVSLFQQNLKGGGLSTDAILSLPQAIQLCLGDALKPPAGTESYRLGVIHCGHRTTSIMVFRNGILQFYRDINMAGETITDGVFNGGEVDGKPWKPATFEEATEIKHRLGILPPDEIQTLPGPDKFAAGQIFAAVEKIFQHIQLSISFYVSQFGESALDKIILTGGSAAMKNFKEFIQESLEIPVETPDVYSRLVFDGAGGDEKKKAVASEEPAMAAAVGLAAYTGQAEIINFIDILLPHRRGGGGGGGSIDLAAVSGKFTEGLAKKLGVSFQLDERKIMILIGLGVLLLLCALAYPVVKIRREVAKAQAEEKTLSASLVELQQTQSEVLSLMADKEGLEKFTAFPDLVRRNKVHNSLVLLRLITATPAEVYLSSFEMHREGDHWRFTVDGTADTPDRPFEFIKRLTETGAFKDVNPRVLDSVVIDEEHAYAKFSLHGTVIPPVPPEPDATTGAGAETDEGPGSPGDATEPGS